MTTPLYYYRAKVVSVYDADTVRLSIDLGFEVALGSIPVRLLGIDAPELGTVGGKLARDYLRLLLPVGREVIINTDKDKTEKYGRYLAVLYYPQETDFTWGGSINNQLILSGHARSYDGGTR